MRRVTIAVIGNAKTTRANVEALIGDIVDSVDEAIIATVYDQTPSEGIIWAEQYAQDKGLPILKYSDNNYDALLAENSREDLKFFMLWSDEDPSCQLAASVAQEAGILAYDLTDGLILIPFASSPITRPQKTEIPESEASVSTPTAASILPTPVVEEEDTLDYDSEYDLEENLVVLVSEMGKIFARSFAKEFKRIIKE